MDLVRKVSARRVWGTEAAMNRWLMEDKPLEEFSRAVGLDLEPLDDEFRIHRGRVDLLCTSALDSTVVVVESTFGRCDMDHAGRALAYAIENDASCAVLVAEQFPPSLVEAFRIFNAPCSKAGFKVRLVQVAAYESGAGQLSVNLAPAAIQESPAAEPSKKSDGAGLTVEGVNDWKTDCADWAEYLAGLLPGLSGKGRELEQALPEKFFSPLPGPVRMELWPAKSGRDRLALSLSNALLHKARTLLVVTDRMDAMALSLLEEMKVLAAGSMRLRAIELRGDKFKPIEAKIFELLESASGTQALRQRKMRLEFWETVASAVAASTNTKMRKSRALGYASHSLVFGLGRPNVRLTAYYMLRRKWLCVDIRIRSTGTAEAGNQYDQLRSHRDALEDSLGDDFAFEWLGNRGRNGEQTLRLKWKGKVEKSAGPYATKGCSSRFSASILRAEKALLERVGAMEDFRW